MSILIDASTPAIAGGTTDPWVTSSFTPPAGSMLVCVAVGDWFGGTPTLTWSSTGITGLTFTQQARDGASNNGLVEIRTVDLTGKADGVTSMTVSVDTSIGSNIGSVKVYVVTGWDTSTPIEATGVAGSSSSTNPLTFNAATITRTSWVFGGVVDWNANGNLSSPSDVGEAQNTTGSLCRIAIRKSAASSAGTITLSVTTSATPPLYRWAAVAIAESVAAPVNGRILMENSDRILMESGTDLLVSEDFTSSGQSAAVGTASETSSALAITRRKTRAAGTATETDSSQPVTRRKTRATGTAIETDTAQPLGTRKKTRAVGISSESDSSQPVTRFRAPVPVGTATSTNIALAVGKRKTRAVVAATETDSSQPITRRKTRAVVAAAETDSSQPTSRRKTRTFGTATEVDSTVSVNRIGSFALAAETDTALAIVRRKTRAASTATEADSAQPLGVRHVRAVGTSTETDTAQPVGRRKTRAVGLASETDTARLLGKVKSIGRALEIDLAGTTSRPGSFSLVSEADTARPIGRVKGRVLGPAISTHAALAITHKKLRTVAVATETDVAGLLGRTKTRTILLAGETDTARALGKAHGQLVGYASEFDSAGIVVPPFIGSPTADPRLTLTRLSAILTIDSAAAGALALDGQTSSLRLDPAAAAILDLDELLAVLTVTGA